MPGAVVNNIGVDTDTVGHGKDMFWVEANIVLLLPFCLSNQIITFIVHISADPMQEGKPIVH